MMRITALFVLILCAGAAQADLAEEIKNLSYGAPVKIVWSQQQAGWTDYLCATADFLLMGYDTEDGKGVRVINDTIACYGHPLLTHDGARIVYTDDVNDRICVINWDGTGRRVLKQGVGPCSDVWYDTETGAEYAVCGGATRGGGKPVYRFNLDDSADSLLLWGLTDCGSLQLSADGTQGVAFIPEWPQIGRLHLPNKSYEVIGGQCLNGMAPDNSYIARLGGPIHRRATLYDSTNTEMFTIDYHEGMLGWEIYHPRWSNHIRFMTRTGPYSAGDTLGRCLSDDCGNLIAQGGANVELYLGRFSEDLQTFDRWIEITDNHKADFCGDSWIDPAPVTPDLNLMPDTLRFYAVPGGADPSTQTVTAYAWGGLDLSGMTAVADAPWLSPSLGTGTEYRRITNTVSIADSGAGTYTATVTVTAGSVQRTYPVILEIEAGLLLTIEPNPVSFRSYPGGPEPVARTLTVVSNKSLAGLTAADDAGWLEVTPDIAGDTVRLTHVISVAGLAADDYEATVTLTTGADDTSYTVRLTHRQFDLDSGLVAYWAFDDGAGTTLTDSAAGAHHGTVLGATWTTGYTGGALDFDKDSADYVSVGTWDPFTNDATISAWLWWRGPSVGSSQSIIGKVSGWGESAYRWNLQWQKAGDITLYSYYSSGNFQTTIPVTEDWVHLAVTKDDAYAVLYINGDSVGAVYDAQFAGTDGSTVPLTIGAIQTGSGAFDGLIDELRLYDRALSPMEVFRIYDGVPDGDTATVHAGGRTAFRNDPCPYVMQPVPPTAGSGAVMHGAFQPGDRILLTAADGKVRYSVRISEALSSVPFGPGVLTPGINLLTVISGKNTYVQRILVLE